VNISECYVPGNLSGTVTATGQSEGPRPDDERTEFHRERIENGNDMIPFENEEMQNRRGGQAIRCCKEGLRIIMRGCSMTIKSCDLIVKGFGLTMK
jgi:hypothetical protein